MRLLRIGAASLNQTPLAWQGNQANIISAIEQAKSEGCQILCLPELCITGYGAEDAFLQRHVQLRALEQLQEIKKATTGLCVSLGLPVRYNNSLLNCACFVVDGEILGFVAKRFLANSGIHYEPRWFKAWPEAKQVSFSLDNREYPLGDLYFEIDGVKIGFEICEDAWVANRPGTKLAERAVDIILNPSASHFSFGKFEIRKRFVLEGSRAFGLSYIYSNLLGNESGRAIYDGGNIIANAGELVAIGPRFSFKPWVLTMTDIDLERSRSMQTTASRESVQISAAENNLIKSNFKLSFAVDKSNFLPQIKQHNFEASTELKMEEFTRVQALSLFDYLRKSSAQGFVVSLSGGADSSTVSCLVAYMTKLAIDELGLSEFWSRLGIKTGIPSTLQEAVFKLLLCVYQSTAHSSATTRTAARTLASALGAEYLELDVSQQVKGYIQLIEQATGQMLDWTKHDIPLQNIQARTRAPSAWLLANLRQSLLLVTSNRSEAAVGYATMDGDTAGSVSPLGGIDKAFIRSYLCWLEKNGPVGCEPISALKLVNEQSPTAELRPPDQHQTDESDLMPYEFLDRVERLALLDKLSPVEIYHRLKSEFPQFTLENIYCWIRRFFQLWSHNQWKRERYAPSFHIDDESLDPKTWCRFPILSGNYELELQELSQVYAKETATGCR